MSVPKLLKNSGFQVTKNVKYKARDRFFSGVWQLNEAKTETDS
jgi:hypothetical protein